MTTYKFQLRFKIPHTSFIDDDVTSTELSLANCSQKILLVSRPSKNFKESVTFDAIGDGFPSLEMAISFGQKTRDTILICCALLRMGVEIGKNEEFLDPSYLKQGIKGQSYVQPKNIDGLVVYPQEAKIEHVSINFSMQNGTPLEKFQRVFSKSFDFCENLDKKLSLAFELYNSHFFELSTRAKFLQLISIVECLAKQAKSKKKIIDHLERLISLSKKEVSNLENISNDEVDYFIQRLHNLKRESISMACQNLIQKYLSDDDAAVFKTCYNIRSKLVHDGTVKDEINITDYFHKLESLSFNLLYSIITKSKNVSSDN